MAKPTREDVLTLLPASAVVQPTELVERADAATGLLYKRAHGLTLGDALTLRLTSSTTTGAPAMSLPSPLAEGTAYEAVPATDDAFRLRTVGGSTINSFSSAGSGRFNYMTAAWVDLDAQIDRSWRYILSQCTAHGGDVEADILTDMATAHTANAYAEAKAAGNPALEASYAPALRVWKEDYAPYLAALFRGVPVRGATDATPTVSEGSPRYRVIGPAVATATSWGTSSAEVV